MPNYYLLGADVLQQIICTIKMRRAPTRHDNIDFKPIITRIAEILPLSVVTADKGYDSEDNHLFVRDGLHAFSVIPARYEHVPIWRTHGTYRKQIKRGYPKVLYNQRNKDETIMSVIKRLFGEHLMSRLTRTQNRELSFRCTTYNMHRLTNLTILVMISTQPRYSCILIYQNESEMTNGDGFAKEYRMLYFELSLETSTSGPVGSNKANKVSLTTISIPAIA